MSPFHKKTLSPTKRICLRLKEAREHAGFALDELAHKTKIDKRHLLALEGCDFGNLPGGPVYHKHFIRAYLTAIGIDPRSYIRQYLLEEDRAAPPQCHPQLPIGRHWFRNLPGLAKIIAVAMIVIGVGGYLGLQVKHTLEPPKLTVVTPPEGLITDESTIRIIGQTDPEVEVHINGQEISQQHAGAFEQTMSLAPGINTILIRASKKHGKTTELTRHVVLRVEGQLSQR